MRISAGGRETWFLQGPYLYQFLAVLAVAAGTGTAASFAFTGTAAREAGAGAAELVLILACAAWKVRVVLARRGIGRPVKAGGEVLFEIRRTDLS